jgi:hypothetical protein
VTTPEFALFTVAPRWCLDTNVVVSFLKEDDEEAYSRKLLPDAWRAFESDIASGYTVAPPQVRAELLRAQVVVPDMGEWLARHQAMYVELDDATLAFAKRVVNAFPTYGRDENYLGDLCVIALAGAWGLTVISNERAAKGQMSQRHPKMPDVCGVFNIAFVSVMGYLRQRSAGRGGRVP